MYFAFCNSALHPHAAYTTVHSMPKDDAVFTVLYFVNVENSFPLQNANVHHILLECFTFIIGRNTYFSAFAQAGYHGVR